MKFLHPIEANIWQGRIDDTTDFDAFRWHQWVKLIDLNNSEVLDGPLNICFVGFCCDQGVERNKGRVGASKGPNSIRKEMSNLPCQFDSQVKLFDAGNILVSGRSLEEAQDSLAVVVDKILSLNMFPVVLGGGHEIAFGHYKGLRRYLDPTKKLGIINFDAHLDIRPYPNGGSSGTMFRQIYDLCQEEAIDYGYFCIGVQKRSNTVALFKSAKEMTAEYILAKDMFVSDSMMRIKKLNRFITKHDQIYMTICADVFSAAYAPGVSASQAIGLEPEQVLELIKYIIESDKVISFDIAEVSPRFDHDKVTSNLAAVLIFAVVNSLAGMKNLQIDIE